MEKQTGFTHFDEKGQAVMVDVSGKHETSRTATASGRIAVSHAVYEAIEQGTAKKGDVLGVARIAGIMAAKATSSVIPLCHPLPISTCRIEFRMLPAESAVEAQATVKVTGQTGVEMEALTAVSAAALTVYDMCKAVQRDMVITDVRLLSKTGGVHGTFQREESI